MILNTTEPVAKARMHAWRRQIGHRHVLSSERGPRPFAVISYCARKPIAESRYVPLPQLTLVALYDLLVEDDRLVTRLVGVAADSDESGFCFGGVERTRFDKDLRLAPAHGRVGPRLDVNDGPLFDLALGLEKYLERCARHPFMPRRNLPRLPTLDGVPSKRWPVVDLATLPKRQVIRLDSPQVLVGRTGTTAFDFVNTRFRVAY